MKVEDDIFFSRFSFFLLPLLSEEYLNHRNSKSIGPRWDWYVNFLFLKDSHPENLIRIPSQRLQHGHKQPTTNNCIQQLFYNYNNNIQTRNQPPDTNHQITSREFLHTHTPTPNSGVRVCVVCAFPTVGALRQFRGMGPCLGWEQQMTKPNKVVVFSAPRNHENQTNLMNDPETICIYNILHGLFIFFWNIDTFSDLVIVGAMLLNWFFCCDDNPE